MNHCNHEVTVGLRLHRKFWDVLSLSAYECVFCRARFVKNHNLPNSPVVEIESEIAFGWMNGDPVFQKEIVRYE